ncbi:unnamed protein product, partial [Iphiclides podalirius]
MAVPVFFLGSAVAILVQNANGECLLRNSYNVASRGVWLGLQRICAAVVMVKWLWCWLRVRGGCLPPTVGGFAVKSASPVPPSAVSVLSENEYSGALAVVGQVPFLGTAYLEGAVPSAGAGAVTYGCGYGDVRIVSEEGAAPGVGLARLHGAVAPWATADIGYNNGWGTCGCGRGILAY